MRHKPASRLTIRRFGLQSNSPAAALLPGVMASLLEFGEKEDNLFFCVRLSILLTQET